MPLQAECEIVEGPLPKEHVHICMSMPPKYTVSAIVVYIKGKSASARQFARKIRNYTDEGI